MAKRRSAQDAAPEDVDEDVRAFRAAVRDVKPLAPTSTDHLARPRARRRPLRSTTAALAAFDAVTTDGGGGPASGDITRESVLAFHRPGVRPQVMRRLRRGLYPIEDELDLHGQTESAARASLALFLAHSRDGALRCVRIVHGKGHRSGSQGPVLKRAVNAWLRRHMDVLAFSSARALDGGTGALYVLLRQ